MSLMVIVRKRPLFEEEGKKGNIDSISCINPQIWVHKCNYNVDGITKYLDHNKFYFDHSFGENTDTEDIFNVVIFPLGRHVFEKGSATIFAYGQTSSGKTFTMKGLQDRLADMLFK